MEKLMPQTILACLMSLGLAALLLAFPARADACGCGVDAELITRALAGNSADATAARADLRAEGPLALTFLDHEHAARAEVAVQDEAAWDALYDQVGQQRGCRRSRLFWYTDLAEAERIAAESNKPIVSLRMLGKLTDEYSCANSRFFRTILYGNTEVSDFLREHVVLHWQSERPVPVVTVNFGDGRMIKTTVTGNSVHYILDAQGRPLEALPGLYGPQPFLEQLRVAVALDQQLRDQPERRDDLLRGHHLALMSAANTIGQDQRVVAIVDAEPIALSVDAMIAEKVTVSKSIAEGPFLRAAKLGGDGGVDPIAPAVRSALAKANPAFGTLDAASRALVWAQMSVDGLADGATEPAVVAELERSIAEDTVMNEFVLHARIHRRFADGAVAELDALNRWMYDGLFQTPASDPWLGLMPHCYVGLDHNGVVATAAKR